MIMGDFCTFTLNVDVICQCPPQVFRKVYHDVEMDKPGPGEVFCMMDVNGVGRIHIKDAPQMMLDLNLIDGVEDDGVRFVE